MYLPKAKTRRWPVLRVSAAVFLIAFAFYLVQSVLPHIGDGAFEVSRGLIARCAASGLGAGLVAALVCWKHNRDVERRKRI